MTSHPAERVDSTTTTPLETYPEFDLDFLVDDPVNPTEITVYLPGHDNAVTHWITTSIEVAVPLETIR